jgi:23S rRNA (adenine2503-C2)-methyltransferase
MRRCYGFQVSEDEAGKLNLIGASQEEIAALTAELGEARFRARQLYDGLYRRRLRNWELFTDLGKALRQKLSGRAIIAYPEPVAVFQSADGTRRYLLEIAGGHRIESVFIPEEKRDTLCVSTQVGCAVACLFCATGRLPMRRNLTAGEIVGQVLALQADRDSDAKRLNVVIMGMGEPLLNYDEVMKALQLMTDPLGMSISTRRITLSTAGIVPALERLAQEDLIPNLAISLNATTDDVRDRLVPINRKWNIAALLETCRRFPLEPRRRITFEYVLIEGINDTPEDALRLVQLLKGTKNKVNLIPLNGDPSIPLKPPGADRVLAFQRILLDHHLTAYIRQPRGADISAACGLLAARTGTTKYTKQTKT